MLSILNNFMMYQRCKNYNSFNELSNTINLPNNIDVINAQIYFNKLTTNKSTIIANINTLPSKTIINFESLPLQKDSLNYNNILSLNNNFLQENF
jgi:hypothetical protein